MRKQVIFLTLSTAVLLNGCDGPNASNAQSRTGIFSDATGSASVTCEGGGIATGDEVAVKGETALRSSPSGTAARIVNEKASSVLNETHHQQLDQTERLKELCRQKDWSKVQVVEPDWLTNVIGWVPVSSLRQIERDASGYRTYVESDFSWDEDTSGFKPQMIANVNKIIRENSSCESVDPGSLSKSGNRSRPGKPVFFVMCNNPGGVFNVWFEPGDAAAGKVFRAVQNVRRGSALLACERAAKEAANNPQTVTFSRFMDVAFVPYPNGNSRLISSFTATNSFGVEGKFRIECFFEGAALTERDISEAIDE